MFNKSVYWKKKHHHKLLSMRRKKPGPGCKVPRQVCLICLKATCTKRNSWYWDRVCLICQSEGHKPQPLQITNVPSRPASRAIPESLKLKKSDTTSEPASERSPSDAQQSEGIPQATKIIIRRQTSVK